VLEKHYSKTIKIRIKVIKNIMNRVFKYKLDVNPKSWHGKNKDDMGIFFGRSKEEVLNRAKSAKVHLLSEKVFVIGYSGVIPFSGKDAAKAVVKKYYGQ
jgi:hypothetical protein